MKKITCTKCGESLGKDQFYKRPGSKNGLRPECKKCSKEYTKECRAKKKNIELKNKKAAPSFEDFLSSIGAVNLGQLLKPKASRVGGISIQGNLTGKFEGFELIVAFENGNLIITG